MTTELILASLTNLQGLFTFVAIVAGLSTLVVVFVRFMCSDQFTSGEKIAYNNLKPWPLRLAIVAGVFGLLACIPTPDDLWRARVALVKLELSSPENIKKGTEHIDALAKALECKYLNQCEEKKP